MNRFKNIGLAGKLAIFILTSAAVIFATAFGYNYYYSKKHLLQQVAARSQDLTLATVCRIESVLRAVEKVPVNLGAVIEQYHPDAEGLAQMIADSLTLNAEVFGMAMAFEPYAFDPAKRDYAPYGCRDASGHVVIKTLEYGYETWDWYQIPRELQRPIWSEPYYDEGGGEIIMSTFSAPFWRLTGGRTSVWGIITADVSLKWLREMVGAIKIYQTGYAFLVSQTGVFITHPNDALIMRESIFSVAEARGDETLRQVGRDMINGKQGFVPLKGFLTRRSCWMYYAPLPSSRWSLGVIFPEDELYADVRRLSQVLLAIGLTGFVALSVVIVLLSGTITRPLRFLARTTAEIARGNLDIELPLAPANDEIGQLTRSFGNMKAALKEYINNLAATTAAKERIESELKIAHTIQMSFLPKRFPPFPARRELDLYAVLEPAREVGGDLYDFFLIDNDRLFFIIGDVSGKGVPAALFMAVTKTLIKGIAESGLTPADVLERVNVEMAADNESMMFVTVFCAELNLRTGELLYANAGHNPPLILGAGQPAEWLKLPPGFVLGVQANAHYRLEHLQLQPGDLILGYTDGVTEAMTASQELFSEARLKTCAERLTSASAQDLTNGILGCVRQFTGGAEQSDDITVLALRYHGPAG